MRDAVIFLALASASFGAAAGLASALTDGIVQALLTVVVGSVLYVAGLRGVARRQMDVLLGAGRGGLGGARADGGRETTRSATGTSR